MPPSRFPLIAIIVGASVVSLLSAAAIGFAVGRNTGGPSPSEVADAQESRLGAVFAACAPQDSGKSLSLEDDGATIVIDTGSEYGDPAGLDCVITRLGTPTSITAQMDRTTAMMGVQRAEHDDLEFSWSYHPDNGVNMVITDVGSSGN